MVLISIQSYLLQEPSAVSLNPDEKGHAMKLQQQESLIRWAVHCLLQPSSQAVVAQCCPACAEPGFLPAPSCCSVSCHPLQMVKVVTFPFIPLFCGAEANTDLSQCSCWCGPQVYAGHTSLLRLNSLWVGKMCLARTKALKLTLPAPGAEAALISLRYWPIKLAVMY